MMKTLILYYSRTGTTERVARALAGPLSATTEAIECSRYDGGWLRYLLAGYDSVKERLPPVRTPEISPVSFDLVLLGAPIWTSYPAVPLRSFLAQKPGLPSRVGVFLTYGGHSEPEKAVRMIADLISAPLAGSLTLPHEKVVEGQCDTEIAKFADEMKSLSGR